MFVVGGGMSVGGERCLLAMPHGLVGQVRVATLATNVSSSVAFSLLLLVWLKLG